MTKASLTEYAAGAAFRELLADGCPEDAAEKVYASLMDTRTWLKTVERSATRRNQFGRFRVLYFRKAMRQQISL